MSFTRTSLTKARRLRWRNSYNAGRKLELDDGNASANNYCHLAENAHVPEMLGWERADNLTEAIAMARSYMGRNAEITMLHQPVIGLCNVTD